VSVVATTQTAAPRSSSEGRTKTSYREILKSSAVIGGSSVVNVLLGIVRTKALAVLIGTEGMGLFGAYSSITNLVGGIAGMGIGSSGVRQIAEAAGTNDRERIARTILVLRRTVFVLGALGMLALLILCRPISKATFGSTAYAGSLALLSVTVLFAGVTGGQTALVQGMRRIGDLAALSIWGAVLGTILSIPVIFVFREKGIVPFLVTVSALTILTSWWYTRKIKVERARLTASVLWTEARSLLSMGVVFMASSVMASAVAYVTRVLVIRQMGLEAAGLYQAAWTLSSVYVGFVLGAMGADYYPRLTAVARDNVEVNCLVNEQTEAALLMAVPGILGTLTLSPWVIHLLYSTQFEPAVDILRWQVLGVLGRVVSWPIGFVLLAKGCAKTFFWTELSSNIVHLCLIWLGMKWFGLSGLGMAFFGVYVFYGLLVYLVVRHRSGFQWTIANLQLGMGVLMLTAGVFLATGHWLPPTWGVVLGAAATVAACLYSFRRLARHLGWSDSLAKIRRLRGR
jgi:enterobacterial common antigen flippase